MQKKGNQDMNENEKRNNYRENTNKSDISERNNGQPYYDENGILRNVPGFGEEQKPNRSSNTDPYEQMYKQQLSEYEKMSGENDLDGDVDLEFHPMSEAYGDNRNRQKQSQNGVQSRRRNPQNNSSGRKPQQRSSQNKTIKNSQKSKSAQSQKKRSSNSSSKNQNSSR